MAKYTRYRVVMVQDDDDAGVAIASDEEPVVDFHICSTMGIESIEEIVYSAFDHLNVVIATCHKELIK